MRVNPYLVLTAHNGEQSEKALLRDAKKAEYKRLHCHEIIVESGDDSLSASVWKQDVLEQRRKIIRDFNKKAGDDDGSDHIARGCEGAEECHTYVSDQADIEALVQDNAKFLEYCNIIIPDNMDDSNAFEEVLQRYIEAREILVELEIKECCQGTSQHAMLLTEIEDYCRREYALDPDKMLVTIVGSNVQYDMDFEYDELSPVQARLHTHADESIDNLKNMNEYYRRREMNQFYKDAGYRVLPWVQSATDRNGYADGTVSVYSKHLSNPTLDKDVEAFIQFEFY